MNNEQVHAALLEYFNASTSFGNTVGHEGATPADEHKAEVRFEAAGDAVRCALATSATPERSGKLADDEREPAPESSLPNWSECNRIIENHVFRQRAAAGLEGQVIDTPPTSPEPTELHRFIYEYDDSDSYRSAWFMHRLEKVIAEVSRPATEADSSSAAPSDGFDSMSVTGLLLRAKSAIEQSDPIRWSGVTHDIAAYLADEQPDAKGWLPSDDFHLPFMCLVEDYMAACDYHGSQKGEKCEAAEGKIRAALIALAAPSPTRESLSDAAIRGIRQRGGIRYSSLQSCDDIAAIHFAREVLEAAAALPPLTWLYTHCKAIGMTCVSDSGKWEHDIALFTINLKEELRAALATPRQTEDDDIALLKHELSEAERTISYWKAKAAQSQTEDGSGLSAASVHTILVKHLGWVGGPDWTDEAQAICTDLASTFAPKETAVQGGVPEAEPVAWIRKTDITELTDSEPETNGWTPLYAAPTGASHGE